MAVSPTYPGVYVQQVPSGVRTIAGVSTSVALFMGFTKTGPVDKPTRCFSYTDYVRTYGDDNTAGDMNRQVKLAFLNGLTEAYVMRIAENSQSATVTLENGAGVAALRLTAKNPGAAGDAIRASISYNGNFPEGTFNLAMWRWVQQPNGLVTAEELETWSGLSMDPNSATYAESFLNSNSALVTAEDLLPSNFADTLAGVSIAATVFNDVNYASGGNILISIDDSRYVEVTLPPWHIDAATTVGDIFDAIEQAFVEELLPFPGTFSVGEVGVPLLQFRSTAGNVRVRPGTTNDAAGRLALGAGQGGLEVSRYASARPVPNGVTLNSTLDTTAAATALHQLLAATEVDVTLPEYQADGTAHPLTATIDVNTATIGDRLGQVRDGINAITPTQPDRTFPWKAEIWGVRLAILAVDGPIPRGADDHRVAGFVLGGAAPGSWVPTFVDNERFYNMGGGSGGSTFQASTPGDDGDAPTSSVPYESAFDIVRKEVDLFNLLVFPRANANRPLVDTLWGIGSVFAEERRALLLMESPEHWAGAQLPANEIASTRIGVSKQYAALYHPRILIREGALTLPVSPVGAIAGIMARTDNARGVWKAPAGTEAAVRGIVGVQERLSDAQNGALNPLGINVVRALPDGIVVWGARTLDGYDEAGSEYKYVPVRRVANFIGESLYRGLRWVVFEPNDEPLWAQIRLNVGAFMHDLFRKGAFQGTKPTDAYFVKCDSETTTQTDRNLGIVNVWVGFAPLKPAEFVIISLQQMAGQSAV